MDSPAKKMTASKLSHIRGLSFNHNELIAETLRRIWAIRDNNPRLRKVGHNLEAF